MGKCKWAALQAKADKLREEVLRVALKSNAGHIAPSLSCVDILVALYYRCIAYRPTDPLWEERDRVILSKGHGGYALYAILADKGVLPREHWHSFYSGDCALSGCVERKPEWGIEAGTGALGHGLPLATGVAYGAHVLGRQHYTFCIVGDGEMQEGSNWEALQFAVKHNLKSLILIVDQNGLQAMDFVSNVLDVTRDDLFHRLKGFGVQPLASQGHDLSELCERIDEAKSAATKRPRAIIARTVKGYGVRCMENIPKFHFRVPTQEELLVNGGCAQNA